MSEKHGNRYSREFKAETVRLEKGYSLRFSDVIGF